MRPIGVTMPDRVSTRKRVSLSRISRGNDQRTVSGVDHDRAGIASQWTIQINSAQELGRYRIQLGKQVTGNAPQSALVVECKIDAVVEVGLSDKAGLARTLVQLEQLAIHVECKQLGRGICLDGQDGNTRPKYLADRTDLTSRRVNGGQLRRVLIVRIDNGPQRAIGCNGNRVYRVRTERGNDRTQTGRTIDANQIGTKITCCVGCCLRAFHIAQDTRPQTHALRWIDRRCLPVPGSFHVSPPGCNSP